VVHLANIKKIDSYLQLFLVPLPSSVFLALRHIKNNFEVVLSTAAVGVRDHATEFLPASQHDKQSRCCFFVMFVRLCVCLSVCLSVQKLKYKETLIYNL